MRDAARDAEVGDDVYGEDPSVNDLEDAAAALLGHEAALFCPSGTMANQVAVRTHTEPGQEVIVDARAHVYDWEVGGLVEHAGVQPRPFQAAVANRNAGGEDGSEGGEGGSEGEEGDSEGREDGEAGDEASDADAADAAAEATEAAGSGTPADRGVPTPAAVRAAHVEESVHRAGTGLLCLENTHNARGGLAIEPERIDAAATAARDLGVGVHLDGARLANAAVALDVPLERFTRHVDTTMLSLSKGLGAPVGSVLAGEAATIERARRHRKLHGGAMRQAGLIAAPGLLALENVERLATDHEHAARLAAGLDDVDGLAAQPPETNVVVVETGGLAETAVGSAEAAAFEARCAEAGVGCTVVGERLARFCTHRDVDADDVDAAVDRVRDVVG